MSCISWRNLALAVALSSATIAVAASTAATPLYPAAAFEDVTNFRLPHGAGHAFSPDGRYVLVSSDKGDVQNAFLLPLAGGDPIAIAPSPESTFALSYFPSDDRILFSRDEGGNELLHIYVRERDGTVRDLTPGKRLRANFLGWTASGDRFFITSNERDPNTEDVYAYDSKTYERQLVFKNTGLAVTGQSGATVSGDGRWLAAIKLLSNASSDLYLVDLADGSPPKVVAPHSAPERQLVLGFSPDSRSLIYSTDAGSEFAQPWSLDIAGGKRRQLFSSAWDVSSVDFSTSGRYRADTINRDSSVSTTVVDTRSGRKLKWIGAPAGDIGDLRFDRTENHAIFTVTADTAPANVYVADLRSGRARRLTDSRNPQLNPADLVSATVPRFKSWDGLEVPGILYRPKGASPARPALGVVLVHGGPGDQSRRGYDSTVQYLVNHGYAVFAINNRGSAGYGKTFFHMDDRRHGDVDLKDVVAAGRWLKSLDWVNDHKVAVMGGSYGGYMVGAALAFQPEAFDVGIDIFGPMNWLRILSSLPPWWGDRLAMYYSEMGDPKTDAERLRNLSPLSKADKIRSPLLVVQGANDPRVKQTESDDLVAAVRKNGVPVEYIVFPDEGHGFQKRENRIKASEAYLAFLDKYLKGSGK